MRLVPVYRPRASALHSARASVGVGFCAALALVPLLYTHPLVLAAGLAATVGAGLAARVGGEMAAAARLAVPLAVLVTVINPLVYHEGNTLLVRGPVLLGQRFDVTLEAIAFGAVAGLRVLVLIMVFGLFSACVDPDEVLRLFRRVSYRSALTTGVATRLVPVLARDATRMGDAARCRAVRRARPLRGRRRRARGARLRARRAGPRGAGARLAPRPARGRSRARPRPVGCRRRRGGSRDLRSVSGRERARRPARRGALRPAAARGGRSARGAPGPAGGGPCLSPHSSRGS